MIVYEDDRIAACADRSFGDAPDGDLRGRGLSLRDGRDPDEPQMLVKQRGPDDLPFLVLIQILEIAADLPEISHLRTGDLRCGIIGVQLTHHCEQHGGRLGHAGKPFQLLRIGTEYTVTEDTNWAWKYDATIPDSGKVTIQTGGSQITVTNTKKTGTTPNTNWLTAVSSAVNRWVTGESGTTVRQVED